MAGRIFLVRHGETSWSRTGQHTGRQDLDLTPLGEQEARQTRQLIRDHAFACVFCSPLQRARRTCEILGYLHRAEFLEELMEWDYGELSGRTADEIRAAMPGWNIWEGPVPGGETLQEVAARARSAILRFEAATPGDVLAVAHGHLLRVLAAEWLGLPPSAARHFALHTAAVSVLGFDNGHPAILRWNSR